MSLKVSEKKKIKLKSIEITKTNSCRAIIFFFSYTIAQNNIKKLKHKSSNVIIFCAGYNISWAVLSFYELGRADARLRGNICAIIPVEPSSLRAEPRRKNVHLKTLCQRNPCATPAFLTHRGGTGILPAVPTVPHFPYNDRFSIITAPAAENTRLSLP